MFIGEYQGTIDDKGRLSIPAKFRPSLKKNIVVTRGLDNSLFLYSVEEWKKLAEKLASLPISTANTRAFSRLMLAGAMDCEVDKIQKKIVFAGLYNRIEVWSEELWAAYKQQTEKESNNIAEQLGNIGV